MNRRMIILISTALIIGLYVLIIVPMQDKQIELRDTLQVKYISLLKNERFITHTQQAGLELKDALTELDEMEQYIIKAPDTSIAFAELLGKVQDIAEEAELQVTSIRPLPLVPLDGYTGLPIYLDGLADINQFSKFLNYLDSTWEFIAIEKMNVSRTPRGTLRVKMQLMGLVKS